VDDGFWNRKQESEVLVGIIREERAPGVFQFVSTCGRVINDAHVLTPDGDLEGGGEQTKPRPGSMCVATLSGNGAHCTVHGFQIPPKFVEDEDDPPANELPIENNSSGDKVYKTSGGATLVLKRGGAVYLEGGAGTSFILNPINNQVSLRSGNFKQSALGYFAVRGRKLPGTTDPLTKHTEDFLHQVGADARDRLRLEHGDLESDARRRLTLSEVTIVASIESVTVKTRETYYSDGSWVGEGPMYRWGATDANEPIVLGNALASLFRALFSAIAAQTHTTAWGPSGPPININEFTTRLPDMLDSILSEFMFVTKKPAELG
jgi:hypothetical protein